MKNKKLFPLAMAAVMGVSLLLAAVKPMQAVWNPFPAGRQLRLTHRAVNLLKLSG